MEVVAFFQRLSLSPLLPPWLPWSVPAGAASFGLGRKSQRDELMAEGGGCWMCSAGCCGCATRSRGVLVVRECVWKVEDSGAFKKEKLPSIKSKRTPATDRQPLFKKIHRHPLVCTRRNTRQPATPSHPKRFPRDLDVMGNQLAAPARVQLGVLLASDVPSLVYKDSLGGACLSFSLSFFSPHT